MYLSLMQGLLVVLIRMRDRRVDEIKGLQSDL